MSDQQIVPSDNRLLLLDDGGTCQKFGLDGDAPLFTPRIVSYDRESCNWLHLVIENYDGGATGAGKLAGFVRLRGLALADSGGKSTTSNTSCILSTKMKSRSWRNFFGISCKSLSFFLGITKLLIPTRRAAKAFSRTPPTARIRPRKVISPVNPTSRRIGRLV